MPRRRKRRHYYSSAANARDDQFAPIGLNLSSETRRGIAIVCFSVAAVISMMGILDLAGSLGRYVTLILQLLFGALAYVTPALFLGVVLSLILGGRLRRRPGKDADEPKSRTSMARTYIGAILFTFAVAGIMHLFVIQGGGDAVFQLAKDGKGGGYLGALVSFFLYPLMGFTASLVVLAAVVVISFLVIFDLSLHGVFRGIKRVILGAPGEPPPAAASSFKPSSSSREPEGLQGVKINTMESLGFSAGPVKKIAPVVKPESEFKEPAIKIVGEDDGQRTALDVAPDKFKKEKWRLPSSDLLEPTTSDVNSGNIEANVRIIKKTLEEFGVFVEMGDVNVGPTVTQYTFRPAVGVKLTQVVSRKDDLALALAAPSIRIEAPIPGKSLVGIEVPNSTKALVGLHDLIESDLFRKAEENLLFALGRDVAGHPMMADLAKMPHLLIAGATGTGKTVCINTILTSLLYRNSPEELRFIIIDPKRVDLPLYNGIPHLLTPVVVDYKQAVNVLKWMVSEMDGRYKILSESGKRNIAEYNQTSKDKMAYLVLIVDELADLMSLAKVEVESSIVRLAQMARAVGLHLILATQRPEVRVITGLIKANITARIAFAVASQVDSRTILDASGAEDLLGGGDMLFISSSLPKPKRIQCPFMSEKEVRRVVGFIKEQSGPVDYQTEILDKPQRAAGVGAGLADDEADDDLINAAIEEIRRAHKASASLLQRRLSVGYARAARILDILEERGLIGPSDGAKPREVFLEGEDNQD
ncbi:MAG: DNA translocase FtsK 4TM domain-containing protein [bacterium]|nr:DNA translocase FtsK 4TM domain-containing protein [bacterium]